MAKIVGILLMLAGIAVFIGAIALEIAWLGFCFGSIIVGLLLLIFARWLLLAPLIIGFKMGMAMFAVGVAAFASPLNDAIAIEAKLP